MHALYSFAMTWTIVGLGNPGNEYENTRHNTGRMALEHFVREKKLGEWKFDKKTDALIARGAVLRALVILVLPETFMNKSGNAVSKFVKSVKAAERLVVVYDDLDVPFGTIKISFDRGSGGHRGIESIARAIKTRRFWRIRVGISPSMASGVLKKPHGEQDVLDFILGAFKPHELSALKSVFKRISNALDTTLSDGPMKAMNQFNS